MLSYGMYLLVSGMTLSGPEFCVTAQGAQTLIEHKLKKVVTLPPDCTAGIVNSVTIDGSRQQQIVPFGDRNAYVVPVKAPDGTAGFMASGAPFATSTPKPKRFVLAPAWHLSDTKWVVCATEGHVRDVLDVHKTRGLDAAYQQLAKLATQRAMVDGLVLDSSCETLQKRVRFVKVVHETSLSYDGIMIATQIVQLEEGFNNRMWYAITTNMAFFDPQQK